MLKAGIAKISLLSFMGLGISGIYSLDTQIVLAAGETVNVKPVSETVSLDQASPEITVAQSSKKKKKKKKSQGRKRILSSERTFKAKKGAKTNLNFDEVDISGQRKTPLGSMVGTLKDRKGFNFIEIRKEWHNEMVQSASNLD